MRSRSVMLLLALVLAATGCGAADGDEALTLYSAQHEELMDVLVDDFTRQTGIDVQMRSGSDFELANQIVQEGERTPADVFVTENSPAMSLVDSKGGFATLDAGTRAQVPPRYVSSNGNWTGFAARSTVFVYNNELMTTGDLPSSILDLAQPQWKGRFGISPVGADFQAIVSAVLALKGEQATAQWLAGLKANSKIYQGNIAVMKAVNSGEIDGGVIYHYYWYKDQAESGANSANTALHVFPGKDPGAFVSVSGAGVLKTSKKQEHAQRFVQYLTSVDAQRLLAESKALEYAIGNDVASNAKLKPLSEIDAPEVDITNLNGPKVVELMQNAGLL